MLKILFSLSLGLLIIWAMYRNTDVRELWQITKSANIGVIAASLIFGLIGNYIRGLRWELFVNSLGYHPPRASLVYATLGNYAVNFVLPRAGDVWRCGVVSRYDKIPFAKTVETFLVDKMLDIMAGLTIIFVSVLLYIDFFISYLRDNAELTRGLTHFFTSVWTYLGLSLLLVAILLMFTLFRKTTLVKKITKFFSTVKYDLALISKMKKKNV